jgi:uncharacterized protein (TIGR03067 family)
MAPRPEPASLPPQSVVQPAGTGDLRRLQGTWSILALESDSREHEPDPDSAVLFAGNALVFVWGAKDRGPKPMAIESGTFVLDAQPQSGAIIVSPTEGGAPRQGIYRLEGPLLLLCLAEQGRPRPTEFDTAPDSGQFLFVLRRKRTPNPDPSRVMTPSGRVGRDIHLRMGSPGAPGMMPVGPGMPGMQRGPAMSPGMMGPGQPQPRAEPAPSATPAPTPAPGAGPGAGVS